MSFQAMTWAVEQTVPAMQKLVLLMLANCCNHHTGQCNPRIKTLAEECGMSETACKNAIKALADTGLLTIRTRYQEGIQLPNQYHLNLEGVGRQTPPGGSPNAPGVGRQTPTEPGSSNQEVNPTGETVGFAAFWKAWPKSTRKGGKDKCLEVWKQKGYERQTEQILAHVTTMAASKDWKKDGGQFVPAPVVYLRSTAWTGAELDATADERFAGAI